MRRVYPLGVRPIILRMEPPVRLLFVCLGNICRSPMAEGALRQRLLQAGLVDRVVHDSAGTGHWHVGDPPDHRAIACAASHGVEIADLRARQLCAGDFEAFDVLLCADRGNRRDVRALAPAGAEDRCMLLSQYAGEGEIEIPDPYGGGKREFDAVWAMVDRMAEAIVRRLAT